MRLSLSGRTSVALLVVVLPVVLIFVTVIWFSANPISLFGLFAVLVGGLAYLMTYSDAEAA